VINDNTRLQRNSEMIDATFDDEVVMMSIENDNYYSLDEIASAIWQKLEEEIPLSELVNSLLSLYDVDYDTCMRDVISFLSSEVGSQAIIQINP